MQVLWPADKVERWPIDKLVPYAKNARIHTEQQILQVASSIKEFGFTNAVLVAEDGSVICGHCRILSAKRLGITEVPVIIARGWSEAQIRAYRIADNKLASNSTFDDEMLIMELGDIASDGLIDMDTLGFSQLEIDTLLSAGNGAGLTDPDDVPEPPAIPVSVLGDVWVMGRHRLACGDCTDAATVALALNGVQPHLMVTDPPYGVDFDPTWRKGSEARTYMGDKPDKEFVWREAWSLFPGDVIYIWHAAERTVGLYQCLDELGFQYRNQIIWNKDRFIIGRGHYCYNHDPCFYGVRKKATAHWQGARDQPTVWTIKHSKSETNHGGQKPVECMKRPIENNSSPGQSVYEPFCGSGTTIIAAEMTDRACHAIELNPAYVDVAVQRWQQFSGGTAHLEADGRPFDQVAIDRAKSPDPMTATA